MTENEVARQVVDGAYKVHVTLGPGLLESVYEAALAYELQQRGLHVQQQVPIAVTYGAVRDRIPRRPTRREQAHGRDQVRGEGRASPQEAAPHLPPPRRHAPWPLINFGGPTIKAGITRLVNGLQE